MTVGVPEISNNSWLLKYVRLEKDAVDGKRRPWYETVKPEFGASEHIPKDPKHRDTPRMGGRGKKKPFTSEMQSVASQAEPSGKKLRSLMGGKLEGLGAKHPKGKKTVNVDGLSTDQYTDVSSHSATPSEGAKHRKKLQADSKAKLDKLRGSFSAATAHKKIEDLKGKLVDWKVDGKKYSNPKAEGGSKGYTLTPQPKKQKEIPSTTKPIKKKPLQADVKDVTDPAMKEIESDKKEAEKDKPKKKVDWNDMTPEQRKEFLNPKDEDEEKEYNVDRHGHAHHKDELRTGEGKIVQNRGQTPEMEKDREELESKKEEEEEGDKDSRYPEGVKRKKLTQPEHEKNIRRLSRKPSSPDKIIDENGKEIDRTKEHEAKGYGDHIPTKAKRDKVIADRKSQLYSKDKPKDTESWEESPDNVEYKRDTQEGGSKFHFNHGHGQKTTPTEHKQYTQNIRSELLGTDDKGTDARTRTKPSGGKGAKDVDETEGGKYTITPEGEKMRGAKVEESGRTGGVGSGEAGDTLDDESGASSGYGGGSEDDLAEDKKDNVESRGTSTANTARGHRGGKALFPKAHPPTHFYRGKEPIKDKKGKITGYTKGTWTKVPKGLIQSNRDSDIEEGSGNTSYHLEGKDEETGITAKEVFNATEGKSNIRNRTDYDKYHKRDDEFNLKDEEVNQSKTSRQHGEAKVEAESETQKMQERIKLEGEYKTIMFGGNSMQKREWNKKPAEEKANDIEGWVNGGKGSKRQTKESTKSMYLIGQRLLSIRLKSLK